MGMSDDSSNDTWIQHLSEMVAPQPVKPVESEASQKGLLPSAGWLAVDFLTHQSVEDGNIFTNSQNALRGSFEVHRFGTENSTFDLSKTTSKSLS